MRKQVVNAKRVFVIHGRNERARKALFAFLRALSLEPLEWSHAVALTRKATPYVGEVLDAAFARAQAVIALLTGDDEARLRREHDGGAHEPLQPQARANVLFEAGMAMGREPKRTLFVELGELRPFSDVGGRHVIRLNDSLKMRQSLAQRLKDARCDVDMTGTDWHDAGDFDAATD
jgi:predicted nucleotide-binding protein